jgi:hypothetical protein
MAPKRDKSELQLKSIWDEEVVASILQNQKHVVKLYNYLISHPEIVEVNDIPFKDWSVPKKSIERIQNEVVFSTSKIVESFESSRGDTTKRKKAAKKLTLTKLLGSYLLMVAFCLLSSRGAPGWPSG